MRICSRLACGRTVKALAELSGFAQAVLYTTGAEAVEGG